MSSHIVALTTLTIPNGQQNSNELYLTDYRDADSLTIFGPAVLPEVVTVQIAPNKSPVAADWADLQRPIGTDLAISAGNATTIELPSFSAIRVRAGAAVAADRVFPVNKAFNV